MKKKLVAAMMMTTGIISGANALEIKTVSPNNKIEFCIAKGDAGISCRLTVEGKTIIQDLPVSITLNGKTYPGDAAVGEVARREIDNKIIPAVPTISSRIIEKCNETCIRFDAPIALRVRVYDDGAAFRWESQLDESEVIVNGEELSFGFAEDYPMYYPVQREKGFFSHQENVFRYGKISETKDQTVGSAPALIELDKQLFMLISDVNVSGYPGLWFNGGDSTTLRTVFPHYPEKTELEGDRGLKVKQYSNFLAKTEGTRSFPWRVMLVTDDAGLLTSTTLYTLAEPSKIEDTSWIKPGKVAWDWWNALKLTDVDFDSGVNQATYKHYIDFASEYGLEYVVLDEGWSVPNPENLLKVVPELDLVELVEYAGNKDVDIILWMTSVALETNFEQAFEQFSDWGVKGIKVDFMQRDDQVMMDFCERIAEEAAKRHLLVDFHGGSKPTGLQRTWPNVLTHESVQGLEHNKWGADVTPGITLLQPFTRMVAGPMDYTPGAMDNYAKGAFVEEFYNPGSQGTRCQQLALYVVFISPLQMLADSPSKYRKAPECMPFLSAVPTTWDETVVLKADVGNVIAMARRNGDAWYVGAVTDWEAREFSQKLDFLGEGTYRMSCWSDGPEAAENGADFKVEEISVTAATELKISMAPGGGFAAIIQPLE